MSESEPGRPGNRDTVERILRIEDLCDRFEDELKAGRRPTVEAFQQPANFLGAGMRGFFDFGVALGDPKSGVLSKGEA